MRAEVVGKKSALFQERKIPHYDRAKFEQRSRTSRTFYHQQTRTARTLLSTAKTINIYRDESFDS